MIPEKLCEEILDFEKNFEAYSEHDLAQLEKRLSFESVPG